MGKREILFRGKRPDDGKWVYGYFTKNRNLCNRVYSAIRPYDPIEGDECVEEIQVVVPETVGQYTGLKDVNGRKIFEGDIVKSKCIKGEFTGFKSIGKIIFKNGAFGLYRNCFIPFDDSIISEVIGNLYDNPELFG